MSSEFYNLTIPYQTKRVRDGAVIIKSPQRDVFDLPSEELKHLVQGIVWRDEHFAGAYINDIAQRESLSARCVRNRIMNSFALLS